MTQPSAFRATERSGAPGNSARASRLISHTAPARPSAPHLVIIRTRLAANSGREGKRHKSAVAVRGDSRGLLALEFSRILRQNDLSQSAIPLTYVCVVNESWRIGGRFGGSVSERRARQAVDRAAPTSYLLTLQGLEPPHPAPLLARAGRWGLWRPMGLPPRRATLRQAGP